jgi:hypothetical protein
VTDEKPAKLCFVIGPIGEEGSPERDAANWLLNRVIKPVLTADPFNYVVKRADELPTPGLDLCPGDHNNRECRPSVPTLTLVARGRPF